MARLNRIGLTVLILVLLVQAMAATVALVWTAAAQERPGDGEDVWRVGSVSDTESC